MRRHVPLVLVGLCHCAGPAGEPRPAATAPRPSAAATPASAPVPRPAPVPVPAPRPVADAAPPPLASPNPRASPRSDAAPTATPAGDPRTEGLRRIGVAAQDCHARYASGIKGRLTLRLVPDAQGAVVRASVLRTQSSPELAVAAFESCVLDAARQAKLSPGRHEDDEVELPLLFEP